MMRILEDTHRLDMLDALRMDPVLGLQAHHVMRNGMWTNLLMQIR